MKEHMIVFYPFSLTLLAPISGLASSPPVKPLTFFPLNGCKQASSTTSLRTCLINELKIYF